MYILSRSGSMTSTTSTPAAAPRVARSTPMRTSWSPRPFTRNSEKRTRIGVQAPERASQARPTREVTAPPREPLPAPPQPKPEPNRVVPPATLPPPKPARPFAQVLVTKAVDTIDDAFMHARRWYGTGKPDAAPDHRLARIDGRMVYQSDRPVILVLGSGWASHAFSKVVDIDKYDVVIVSPRNHFVFTPMLPSTAVGSIEFRSLLEPVRMANPYVSYFEAQADTVDLYKQTAKCHSVTVSAQDKPSVEFEIPYDYLLMSVGEKPATFGIPGVAENCFYMKEVSDSVRMRKRIQEQFERAAFMEDEGARRDALRFVVVGGGPTGVEFAGSMSDFLSADLVKRYPQLIQEAEVVMVQSAPDILPMFDAKLRDRALRNLVKLGVDVRTGVRVTEVKASTLTLSTGEEMGYGVCLWSAGNQSRELTRTFVQQVPEQRAFCPGRPEGHKIAVDEHMRIIGLPNAFAVGDCSKVVTGPLPPTAQVAGQQGAHVARVMNRNSSIGTGGVDSEPPYRMVEAAKSKEHQHGFEFLSLGTMAYVGNSKAIMELDMDVHAKFWGDFAFLLWRSVYIAKQVSMRNRVTILFDWAKSKVFGRDISLF